jgi:hypothetical protein
LPTQLLTEGLQNSRNSFVKSFSLSEYSGDRALSGGTPPMHCLKKAAFFAKESSDPMNSKRKTLTSAEAEQDPLLAPASAAAKQCGVTISAWLFQGIRARPSVTLPKKGMQTY